jgi:condensin-2 complex subunit D3
LIIMSLKKNEMSHVQNAVRLLLSPQDNVSDGHIRESYETLAKYLCDEQQADGVSASARDAMAMFVQNGEQWEQLTSTLTNAMEQRQTEEAHPSFGDESDDDVSMDELPSTSVEGGPTLTLTTLLSATVYAQLLRRRGALAVGLVSMNAIAALANVINRWKDECCCCVSKKGGFVSSASVIKKSIRRKGRTPQDGDDMEEFTEFDSLPIKRNRRGDPADIPIGAKPIVSDNDYDDHITLREVRSKGMIPHQLLTYGLRLARIVCQIPLQNEFSKSFKMEAVEVIIGCVTTLMATVKALVSGRSNHGSFDADITAQEFLCVIDDATKALNHSILVSEENQDLIDKDEDWGKGVPTLGTMSRRHDIVVTTLRCLYSVLVMKENLPKGETGKVAAADLAATTLECIIQEVNRDIQINPLRWPNYINRNPECTVAASVSSTILPSSRTFLEDVSSPSTPKTETKFLRPASGRESMTPKLKIKTPAMTKQTPKPLQTRLCIGPVLSAFMGLLQQLATAPGMESSSFRASTITTIRRCVKHFQASEQTYFLQFLVKLCHSKVPVHRLVAVELIGHFLSEDWIWTSHCILEDDWNQIATGIGITTPQTPERRRSSGPSADGHNAAVSALFVALKGRLVDRTPTIRSSSANGISIVCRRLLALKDDNSISRLCFLSVLSEHIDELVEMLRVRVASDDKATVRRVTCTALADILIVGATTNNDDIIDCPISELDIRILGAACQDSSLMTRRSAAEALTCLLECVTKRTIEIYPTSTELERAWTISIFPLVLDTETSCVGKAIELIDRIILRPILHHTDTDTDEFGQSGIFKAKATAWRILANLGNGTENGFSRTDTDALRIALRKCVPPSSGMAYTPYAYASIFRMIHKTAIDSLNTTANDLFEPPITEQRTGVWCLFHATVGNMDVPTEIARAIKQSKIDLTFLATSWDKLLTLFLSSDTPLRCKLALQKSMRDCLYVTSQLAMVVKSESAKNTANQLQKLLGNFSLPPEIIGYAVAAIIAVTIAAHKNESQYEQYRRCADCIRALYKNCEMSLSSFVQDIKAAPQCARALFTIGELSMVGFSTSDDINVDTTIGNTTVTPDSDNGAGNSNVSVRGLIERPSKKLIEFVQAFMTSHLPTAYCDDTKPIPVSVRAHAFVAIGKLCLRDPNLVQKSLNILARELHDSIDNGNWIVQSNSLLVLGDLCVKYTNMVDRFLPVMAACLQAGVADIHTFDGVGQPPSHGSSLVRKHAILLLSSLLLQDYLKWRGLLFHRFLVATVDDDDDVADLAEMTLLGPLISKHPRLFANQFVESIFVLNHCRAHPIFKAAAAAGDGGSGISVGFEGINLDGELGRIRRMRMYQMMLSSMSDEDKIGVTARIGKEVLGGALKSGSELNVVVTTSIDPSSTTAYEAAFNVLSDALTILRCPQLRVGKSNRSIDEDIEDPNVSSNNAQRALVAKGRLLSNVSRKHLIEILMPILCNLKLVLEKSRSPLLKDLMMYLLDVYQRYKTEAQECLANDPTTLQEIEYDAQQLKLQRSRAVLPVPIVASTDDDFDG